MVSNGPFDMKTDLSVRRSGTIVRIQFETVYQRHVTIISRDNVVVKHSIYSLEVQKTNTVISNCKKVGPKTVGQIKLNISKLKIKFLARFLTPTHTFQHFQLR